MKNNNKYKGFYTNFTMFFNKKQSKNNGSFDKTIEEIKIITTKVVRLEAELEALNQKQKNLRSFVNRKLKLEEETEQNETFNNDDGFGFIRKGV